MARMMQNRRLRDLFFFAALGVAAAFLLLHPEEAIDAAKSGLKLCGNVVIPSLFPFFVLSSLMINLGMVRYLDRLFAPIMRPLFGLSGACSTALALGMVGGYPVGARTAQTLYENHQISRREAERLLAFCNNCGPAFLFGVVGAGVFSSSSVGLLLYLIHLLVSLLIGVAFRLILGPVPKEPLHGQRTQFVQQRFSAAFTGAVRDGCSSTIQICAFILCFTVIIRFTFVSGALGVCSGVLGAVLKPLHVRVRSIEAVLVGMIELSSGVWGLKEAGAGFSSQVAMAAFLLGWAGLCVHCQVLSFTGDSRLSMRPYLVGKLLHGAVSAALIALIYRVMPLQESAEHCYLNQVSSLCEMDFHSALQASTLTAGFVLGFVCLLCFYSLRNRSGNRRQNRL